MVVSADAYAATAQNPYIGPAIAPGAAASAMSGALSFMPMASAAGVWDNVPYDGAVTELHKK